MRAKCSNVLFIIRKLCHCIAKSTSILGEFSKKKFTRLEYSTPNTRYCCIHIFHIFTGTESAQIRRKLANSILIPW